MSPASARMGRDHHPDDCGRTKAFFLRCVEPLAQRPWLRTLVFCLACECAGLAAAFGVAAFDCWYGDCLADLARQRRCLGAFLRSEEFAAFPAATDAQLAALNNFIVARPRETSSLLPEVAAFEAARGELGWAFEALPLPMSAAEDPAQVYRAQSALLARLAQHGWRWDEPARRAARAHYVRLLTPAAAAFLRRAQSGEFPALPLDRPMQEQALAAFAARHGRAASALRVERMFGLLALIGPEMRRAVEAERDAGSGFAGDASPDVAPSTATRKDG